MTIIINLKYILNTLIQYNIILLYMKVYDSNDYYRFYINTMNKIL